MTSRKGQPKRVAEACNEVELAVRDGGMDVFDTQSSRDLVPKIDTSIGGSATESPLPNLGVGGDDDLIKELVDEEGRTYYHNQETGRTGWKRSDVEVLNNLPSQFPMI